MYLLIMHNIKSTDEISQELIISTPILQKIYNENKNSLIWQKWTIRRTDEFELINQFAKYIDNLSLEPILPIKPSYNFIIPESQDLDITTYGSGPQYIGQVVGGLAKRITENLLPLTHVLLLNNIFYGIYYYDRTKHNKKHLQSLKNTLLLHYNNLNDKFLNSSNGIHLNNINNPDYWNTSRYYIISYLDFSINNNENLTINRLSGGLLEKGSGHLFLCLFLNLIRDIFNENMLINLQAATFEVITHFYKNIGFNCDYNNRNCNATIKNLIIKCNEENKNNFDNIQIMLKIKDIYYNNLTDIKEPLKILFRIR